MHPHLHIHIPIPTQGHTYSKYQNKTGILRVICLVSHRTYMSTVVDICTNRGIQSRGHYIVQ